MLSATPRNGFWADLKAPVVLAIPASHRDKRRGKSLRVVMTYLISYIWLFF